MNPPETVTATGYASGTGPAGPARTGDTSGENENIAGRAAPLPSFEWLSYNPPFLTHQNGSSGQHIPGEFFPHSSSARCAGGPVAARRSTEVALRCTFST